MKAIYEICGSVAAMFTSKEVASPAQAEHVIHIDRTSSTMELTSPTVANTITPAPLPNPPVTSTSKGTSWLDIYNVVMPTLIASGFAANLPAEQENIGLAPDKVGHDAAFTRLVGSTMAASLWYGSAALEGARLHQGWSYGWRYRMVQNTLLAGMFAGYTMGAYALGNENQGSDAALGTWAIGVGLTYGYLYAEWKKNQQHGGENSPLNKAVNYLNGIDPSIKKLIGWTLYEMSAALLTHDFVVYNEGARQGDDWKPIVGSTGKLSAVCVWHVHALTNIADTIHEIYTKKPGTHVQQLMQQRVEAMASPSRAL